MRLTGAAAAAAAAARFDFDADDGEGGGGATARARFAGGGDDAARVRLAALMHVDVCARMCVRARVLGRKSVAAL